MEKKTLALTVGIVILGLAIMVGVVLFLRARAAPQEVGPLIQTGSTGTPKKAVTTGKKGIPPFTPYDKIPKAQPYKQGAPIPLPPPSPFQQPSFTNPTTNTH